MVHFIGFHCDELIATQKYRPGRVVMLAILMVDKKAYKRIKCGQTGAICFERF